MVHLTGFRSAVDATYGLEPFYRIYKKGGEIRAVFPGFFHPSRIYGRKIVSQPFSEYGGLLLGRVRAGVRSGPRSWTSSAPRPGARSGSSVTPTSRCGAR